METLRETILALARRYDFEEGHSLQDERLALRLFDETARLGLHDLHSTPGQISPRDILSYAALLHDIGYIEGYEAHHKTAFRLIAGEPIGELAESERLLIAHVARYHRGATPDGASQPAYAALSAAEQHLIARLGSLLRFADGLDRSHTNAVQGLTCDLVADLLIVTLLPGTGDAEERWAGQKKARWFESVFAVKVALR